jgi:hypothetical protein
MRCVRVSCQTIALPTGSPVVRSQTTVVSRWFVMPNARVAGLASAVRDRAGDDVARVRPDLGRVVLDPAGAREDLAVLLLVGGDDPAVVVEEDATGARRPLVDGGHVVGHRRPSGRSRRRRRPRT